MSTREILAAAACVLIVALAGCHETSGSGRVVTRTVPVESFSRIKLSHGFDVNVSPGEGDRVTLRIDDNLVDDVDVAVTDGTLRIGLTPRTSAHDATLHADVSVRTISTIEQSGGTVLHLADGISVDKLDIKMSGGSRLDAAVHVTNIGLNLSGASHATLTGGAAGVALEANGASVLQADVLQVNDAVITLSGASRAMVSVRNTISAELSGASLLRYQGSPTVARRHVTGSSSITKG